jgi:hypothetical protein
MAEGLASLAVPHRLSRAFEGRTTLTFKEAAAALEMDERLLRTAVKAGRVKYIRHGQGQARVQRRFLLIDLLEFLNAERRRERPFTPERALGPTGRNSRSMASDFGVLRARLNGARPRSQSGR